jgi:hypothetical protein
MFLGGWAVSELCADHVVVEDPPFAFELRGTCAFTRDFEYPGLAERRLEAVRQVAESRGRERADAHRFRAHRLGLRRLPSGGLERALHLAPCRIGCDEQFEHLKPPLV